MSVPEEMIADALREMAAQAGAPRPMADAAWRAGRRRRLAALTASALAGAAAIVAAVLLPLAAYGGPAHEKPPSRPASQQSPAPIRLRSPIQFRQVAAISNTSCPAGSGGLPDSGAPACVFLTGTGMTVSVLLSAQVAPAGNGSYLLEIDLTPAQTGTFAVLTQKLWDLSSPRDQLAVIIDGRVIDHPAVQGPVTCGTAEIAGFATRAQAESLLSSRPDR